MRKNYGSAEKHQLFITVDTSACWIKPAQPAEPILLAPTLHIGALWAIANRAGLDIHVFTAQLGLYVHTL